MLIQRKCKNCDKKFTTNQSEINRGHGLFCSLSCSAQYNAKNRPKKPPNTKCNYCGKLFHRALSKKNNSKSGLQFCCRKCKDEAQKIVNGFVNMHPKHYNNSSGKFSYRAKVLRGVKDVKCNRCGYNKILSVLVVHHIDRNKSNNIVSNLEVLCRNCHYEEHMNDGYSIP